jgi:hypothetical protein
VAASTDAGVKTRLKPKQARPLMLASLSILAGPSAQGLTPFSESSTKTRGLTLSAIGLMLAS